MLRAWEHQHTAYQPRTRQHLRLASSPAYSIFGYLCRRRIVNSPVKLCVEHWTQIPRMIYSTPYVVHCKRCKLCPRRSAGVFCRNRQEVLDRARGRRIGLIYLKCSFHPAMKTVQIWNVSFRVFYYAIILNLFLSTSNVTSIIRAAVERRSSGGRAGCLIKLLLKIILYFNLYPCREKLYYKILYKYEW